MGEILCLLGLERVHTDEEFLDVHVCVSQMNHIYMSGVHLGGGGVRIVSNIQFCRVEIPRGGGAQSFQGGRSECSPCPPPPPLLNEALHVQVHVRTVPNPAHIHVHDIFT